MANSAPLPHAQYGALLPDTGFSAQGGAPAAPTGPSAPQFQRPVGGRMSAMKHGGEGAPLLKKQNPGTFKPIMLNIVLQPIFFLVTYYVFSFIFRGTLYDWMWTYVWSGFVVLSSFALLLLNRRRMQPDPWISITAGLLITTALLGAYYGNENYANMKYYYTFRGMATYVNINPGLDSGRGFSDAGEIYFKEGSRIDYARAVAFKNTDLFCAAPIIMVDPEGETDEHTEPLSYDFWAVGINCCSPGGEAFTCGDGSSLARSGMRVLEDIDTPYYRFAVHQFSAKFLMPAHDPLFFYWTLDPLGSVATKHVMASIYYHEAVWTFVIVNAIVMLLIRFSLIQLAGK